MWRYNIDRGLCFFQVILVDDEKKTARASLGQVRRAASALILQCAAGGESVGGMAKNIGNEVLFFCVFSESRLPSHLWLRKYDQVR